MSVRDHSLASGKPIHRVIVQPSGRGPIWIGDFDDLRVAKQLDDEARMWLFHLQLLRCSLSTGWHDKRRVYRVLALQSEPLPRVPERLARWLSARGWIVPGTEFKLWRPIPAAEEFFAKYAELSSRLDMLEQQPATEAPDENRLDVL